MKTIAGFTIGVIATLVAVTYLVPQQTHYEVETIVRTETITNEVLTTIDLEQLRIEYADLAEELRQECLHILERETGDPRGGIEAHVARRYQGDACKAADQQLTTGTY